MVNLKRGSKGKLLERPKHKLHTVGMDIGYGDGKSPGGFTHCLVIVDLATRHAWTYGLANTSSTSIVDALWRFFIDAGGFPKRVRCDFDKRLIQGDVGRLLKANGVKIGASPPHRQSQNGAVERLWNTACEMGRSFLAEAQLPKRYWFWAIRTAIQRMNMLPCRNPSSRSDADDAGDFVLMDDLPDAVGRRAFLYARLATSVLRRLPPEDNPADDPAFLPEDEDEVQSPDDAPVTKLESIASRLTTPYELFYGVQPDYRVLFPFGAVGYYRKPLEASSKKRSKFKSRTAAGIAIGRSDFTNGMVFWDPDTSKFSTSADYKLDASRTLTSPFPHLKYDGGINPSLDSGRAREAFPPGSAVVHYHGRSFLTATVRDVPTPKCPWYVIMYEDETTGQAEAGTIYGPDDPMYPPDTYQTAETLEPTTPHWVRNNSKVTIAIDGVRRPGYLMLNDRQQWTFVQRDPTGQETFRFTLPDLPTSWKGRILEGSLEVGWSSSPRAYHVSVSNLNLGCPKSFRQSMRSNYSDRQIWLESYAEEYGSLREQETFTVITRAEYEAKYSHITVLPSMVVQTVKHDEVGVPVRAKTRVVALGNYETTPWKKSECHEPVLQKSSSRLLTSLAIEKGRIEKQGDCKNAFLHAILPDDEVVIVEPPPGCPLSKPGDLWLLNKTLYGLRRSPFHWYSAFKDALVDIGLQPCAHDPCVFTGIILDGEPPIYLGAYVDDFKYFSESDAVERHLERELASRLQIDWMGPVNWYLGCRYDWSTDRTQPLTVSITQTAHIESLLDQFGMQDCNAVGSSFRSGLVIDRLEHDGLPPESKPGLVKDYQKLVGGLNWLGCSTRPEITAAVSLLSRHLTNPSSPHLDSAKYVLSWLKGTLDHGIRFTQGECCTEGLTAWPERPLGDPLSLTFTDANWGPQDASHPKPGETIEEEEVRSLLGHVVMRMGGPIIWGCVREPKKASRSSCEAEIGAMDEGCKSVQQLRNIMHDLQLPDVLRPTPLYNDNNGAVEWSEGVSISKKMRHLNIRECAVRGAQQNNEIEVDTIPGHSNIADLFTKEFKSDSIFRKLVDFILSPRLLRGVL